MKNKKVVFSLRYRSNKNPNDYSIAMTYWYGVLDRLGYEVLYYDYDEYNIDDLYNTIKEFKADYFIHTNYLVGVHKEFDKIKELCKVFLLSTDAYRFHDSNLKYWIPFVDGVITFEGVKEWYLRDGLPEKGFLKMKWGFNPNMMCTEDIDKKSINIQHYGGLHGGRDHKISQFNQLGHNITQEPFISYSEIKKNLARSKYSLCFSSNAVGTRNELKGRVIEIPSQAVLLTEPAPELDTYFNDDEIIVFNSIEEAVNRINSITEDEYNTILKKGQKALWNRNTAYHEWNKILPLIDPDYIKINPIDIIKKYHNEYYKG